jgi:hypothetical protein
MKTTREEIVHMINMNNPDLVTTYLLEERPQNTLHQSTSLLSLLANHYQAKVIVYNAAKLHYMKMFNIHVLVGKENEIISYY